MKSKAIVVTIVAFICLLIGGGILFYKQADTITVAAVYLSSQSIQAKTTGTLHKDIVKNNWIHITDESGKKVNTTFTRVTNSLVEATSIPVGKYTLHINKKAINKWYAFGKEYKLNFEVVDTITTIDDEKTLLQYFQLAFEEEKKVSVKADMSSGTAMVEQEQMASNKSSDSSYSETNNQVEGIEESDITVTDGKIIYSIYENEIVLTDANPTNMKIASKISLNAMNHYIESLLLHNQYLIVSYMSYPEDENQKTLTKVNIYDVSDPTSPQLIREFGQEGYRIAIRKDENTLYLVSSHQQYFQKDITEVEQVIPVVYDSKQAKEEQLLPIEHISILPAANSTNYTIISAIDLQNLTQSEPITEAYLGSAGGFYMSHNAMYITAELRDNTLNKGATTLEMDKMIMPTEPKETMIYRYALNKQAISFTGMTTLEGAILNQFSMDEFEGHLRVATTKNLRQDSSTSGIVIFDDQMNEVGRIDDLAKGERIYSARFIGERAFIVTFKEVDPLFTFDLSEPSNPTLLGELKIPGYSTYLHPIGEGHILGIGQNTEQKKFDDGSVALVQNGMKISLFDTRDLSNPIEQDVAYITGEGSYSPALYDHHALFIHAELGLYGLPVEIYDYSNEQIPHEEHGAIIYKITPEQGIEEVASLMKVKSSLYTASYRGIVQRMLYINNSLYVIKNGGISAYTLSDYTLQSEIAY